MPFIAVTYDEMFQVLKDPEKTLKKLLLEGKINPVEAELLEKIALHSTSNDLMNEIHKFCIEVFGNEGEAAFRLLTKFIKSKDSSWESGRVPWVIFSRSFQGIDFLVTDPLDNYYPQLSRLVIIKRKYEETK